uniref:UDP-glucose 4-epimerase n=1 Tax=Tetradesmus obliquus TaxID=3088 RepID=A0A383W948_TETOB
MPHVFVTGGLGFIGSHTTLVLLEHGHSVVILDNLSNAFERVFTHMKKLAGDKADKMKFVQGDLRDKALLDKLFSEEKFDAVIHFAGFKAVGESVEKPLEYYDNNFCGSVALLEAMRTHKCMNLVFSSSCTVYGMVEKTPITEDFPLAAVSPYGRTKLFQEDMYRDVAASDPSWRILLLRYFNPVGAHPSGDLGEHPVGIPNNLMPYVQQVALGQREFLRVFGGDYPTPDGSAIRDYIHVMDLAEGHVAAVKLIVEDEKLGCKPVNLVKLIVEDEKLGCKPVNLGTGRGTSVLEMIKAFEENTGAKVPYKVVDRRAGDTIAVWAATELAESLLGWKSKLSLADMCRDQWAWASKYPQGYETPVKEDQQ